MRNYDKAKTEYKNFTSAYQNSKLVPDAYYWIGKSAENLGQTDEAIFNFDKVFNLLANVLVNPWGICWAISMLHGILSGKPVSNCCRAPGPPVEEPIAITLILFLYAAGEAMAFCVFLSVPNF